MIFLWLSDWDFYLFFLCICDFQSLIKSGEKHTHKKNTRTVDEELA